MTVIMGRLSDLVGAKKMLMIMMACFTVGTILAPFANDISTLIAIRALQGIAIANTPISTKLIRDQFPKSKFPIGMSIYLAAYSGGMALGAVLGPIVAAGAGWQANFYFCAPIAVILSLACWRFIRVDEGKKIHEHDHVDACPNDISTKAEKQAGKQRLDFIGIITMAVTLVSFLIAITYSGSIVTNPIAFVVPLAIGVIFLVIPNCGKASKISIGQLEVSFSSSYFNWKHHNVDVRYFTVFRYYWNTAVGSWSFPIRVRTRTRKCGTSTVGFWSINDYLWANFWVDNSKKKRTQFEVIGNWHYNCRCFIFVAFVIPFLITSY